jgi:multidrug efflux pump subunit AcrA (membrane-fusion protein)
VLTELELRKLRLAAERSLLQLEQAEHRQELLRLDCEEQQAVLASYSVATQLGGMVTKVSKRPGEAVREGETVVEIVNTARLRVEGYVPLDQSWRIAVGQAAATYANLPQVDLPIEQVAFPSRIVFIEPKVEPVTQRVRIVAEVVNEENQLRDGLQATLLIDVSPIRQAGGTTGRD